MREIRQSFPVTVVSIFEPRLLFFVKFLFKICSVLFFAIYDVLFSQNYKKFLCVYVVIYYLASNFIYFSTARISTK